MTWLHAALSIITVALLAGVVWKLVILARMARRARR